MMISFILVLVVQTLDGAIHPADNHYIKQLSIRALRKSPATSKTSKDILGCFFVVNLILVGYSLRSRRLEVLSVP